MKTKQSLLAVIEEAKRQIAAPHGGIARVVYVLGNRYHICLIDEFEALDALSDPMAYVWENGRVEFLK